METLDFKTAFNYPFNRAKGLWNILWILVPIIGWFALVGYGVRIIQEFTKGKFKKLPVLKFKSDLKLGFFMFLKAIPFILACMVFSNLLNYAHPWIFSSIMIFIDIFIFPILCINFVNKQTVSSLFEFSMLNFVFNNLGDYIVAILKEILLQVIFLIMIIILVGLPAGAFTQNIFLADFYRRNVVNPKNL